MQSSTVLRMCLFAFYSSSASVSSSISFFFNAPAPTEIYTLSLHDALPIYAVGANLVWQVVDAPVVECDAWLVASVGHVLAGPVERCRSGLERFVARQRCDEPVR